MSLRQQVAAHWGRGDVFARIVRAMEAANITADEATVERMAPVDHIHAMGLAATAELADLLQVHPGAHLLDIGCGLGGPARYMAGRFSCRVTGIDITPDFVDAAMRLTALLGMTREVAIVLGDGAELPWQDTVFDGAYAQHVTMNVPDRAVFFAEAFRVLRPGAPFALTEHALGPRGNPRHPVPWSEDGSGAWLLPPEATVAALEAAGFADIVLTETGKRYHAGYERVLDLAAADALPGFGAHLLLGPNALEMIENAARNIAEGRTRPVRILCRRPA